MNARLREIQQRRAALIALSDVQRATLVLKAQRWERPLAYFDAGFAIARSIGTRPILVLLGVALLARSRWPRIGVLLERTSIVWQVARAVREFWPLLRSAPPTTPGSAQEAR